jgi:hypothetical protein
LQTGLPELDTDLSRRVRAVIDEIRSQYTNDMLVTVIKEDDPRLRAQFLSVYGARGANFRQFGSQMQYFFMRNTWWSDILRGESS